MNFPSADMPPLVMPVNKSEIQLCDTGLKRLIVDRDIADIMLPSADIPTPQYVDSPKPLSSIHVAPVLVDVNKSECVVHGAPIIFEPSAEIATDAKRTESVSQLAP